MTSRAGLATAAVALVVGLGAGAAAGALLLNPLEVTGGVVDGPHVRLEVGDDFAEITGRADPGTTFVVAAGVHREQTLLPDDGDVIVGEPGAVMSGAVVLDPAAFEPDGERFVLDGRTEEAFIHGQMIEGFERDAAHHELWAGRERLQHAPTRDDVDAPGEWFFDYDVDQLVVFDPPDRREPLELSVTDLAIGSEADDVEVRGLTITRYSSPSQRGAVEPRGAGWVLTDLVVTENHGGGIAMGEGSPLSASTITHNGQWGVGGEGVGGLTVTDVEIAYNGTLGYEWFWEAGGTKFKHTDGAVFDGSWVHHNGGPGIWFDLDNTDITVTDNVAEANEVMGIFLEVSDGAVVRGNTVRGNGFGPAAGELGAGLAVHGVSDAVVTGNVLVGNALELSAVHYERDSEVTGNPFTIEGLEVRDNHFAPVVEGSVSFYVDNDDTELYTDGSITFEENTYDLTGCEDCFRWGEITDAEGWRAAGNDAGGTFLQG
ncbi:right-handed parallel beta-helix repeat-containing protein [Euzebya sp.]|uniref:right-handed parallel beta-helix repeat-containing protein n=1 Tax=Euzebya sp. TaxID=1971409 RepID=UPI003519B9DC